MAKKGCALATLQQSKAEFISAARGAPAGVFPSCNLHIFFIYFGRFAP
jgi:hypothetical protein